MTNKEIFDEIVRLSGQVKDQGPDDCFVFLSANYASDDCNIAIAGTPMSVAGILAMANANDPNFKAAMALSVLADTPAIDMVNSEQCNCAICTAKRMANRKNHQQNFKSDPNIN